MLSHLIVQSKKYIKCCPDHIRYVIVHAQPFPIIFVLKMFSSELHGFLSFETKPGTESDILIFLVQFSIVHVL